MQMILKFFEIFLKMKNVASSETFQVKFPDIATAVLYCSNFDAMYEYVILYLKLYLIIAIRFERRWVHLL